ncbi:unnamed protein product [Effrenium voratum]|nr:unnamed protein product [Effrenium voratum]
MVVVGAGGAGKTETILLAMENAEKTKASFDLRSWYLAEKNLAKGDYDGSVKADQLSLLHSREAAIKEDIGGKSADVIFFDEVDLGDGYLNADELEAMKVLLKWGNEEAPSKAKVVVLHPLVSVQPEVHSLLSSLGFPVPGAATWIDFSQPYSDQVEEAMVRGILQACDPPATDAQIAEVKAYFLGLPSAYMPFLVNKNDVLNGLTGPAAAAIAGVVKPKAKAKVGGRLIMINVGIQASTEARTGIKALLSAGGELPKSGVEHMAGAIASMVVEARGGKYVIPPVMVEALTEYCDGADAKGKSIVAPICA